MTGFKAFMHKNGTTIATAGSIILTVTAVVLAIKSAKKGSEIEDQYQTDLENADDNAQLQAEAKVNYIKNLAKTYAGTLVCTGGSILLAYISRKADAKQIANLGAALAFNEEKVKKLYNYIEHKVLPEGKNPSQELTENDPDNKFNNEPIKVHKRYRKEEPINFRDSYDGTLFESTLKDYYAAKDRAELILSRQGAYGLGFNRWRNLLGLEDTPAGSTIGWRPNEFKTYLQEAMQDGVPYYIICYKEFPNSHYWK